MQRKGLCKRKRGDAVEKGYLTEKRWRIRREDLFERRGGRLSSGRQAQRGEGAFILK